MSDSIDDAMDIEGTEDMGGFSLPPIGNIAKGTGVLMCFTGEITVCGDEEDGLLFEVEYAEDPSAKAKIYCNVTKQAGLSKIVGIGRESGVFDKIDKVRIAGGKKPIQSAEGAVKVKILTGPKFMNQMRKEIIGCSVYCTISHAEAKPYEDKNGITKDGFAQANISKIVSVKKYKADKFGAGKVENTSTVEKSARVESSDDDFD